MFFSVVIPLYNKEAYIENSLRSVIDQTFRDLEIIIVDDGSTDGSYEKVLSFRDPRIRLFRKKNGGVSSARNFGIDKARGFFIAFLDADDWWDRKYLQKMYAMIHDVPDYKIYGCCNAEVLPDGKYKVNPVRRQLKSQYSILDYDEVYLNSTESPIHTSAVVVSYDLLCNHPFMEDISVGEDLLLWLKLTESRPVVMLDEVLAFYNRIDPDSATYKLAPLSQSFIGVLSKMMTKLSVADSESSGNINSASSDDIRRKHSIRRKLITRLILSRMKRYYLFHCDDNVESILASCNPKDASIKQRMFYRLPKTIGRFVYKFIKRLPDADSADK